MKKTVLSWGAMCALATMAAEPLCIWPNGGMTVVPGDCAKVTQVGDEVRVDVDACKKTVWPAAYFKFATTTMSGWALALSELRPRTNIAAP